MNALLEDLPQALGQTAETARALFNALSLHAPGAVAAVAVLALCALAAVVVLDASRRTLAVPTWSYLRRDVAQLAAERDGKRGLVDSLRGECETLERQLEKLHADKRQLAGVTERRQHEETVLRDVLERLARVDDDRAFVDALRGEIVTLKSERTALQSQIADLQAERAETESELTGLRAHEARLQSEMSDVRAAREATGAEVEQARLELETLRRRTEAARLELQEAEQRSRQEAAELNALERERERMQGEASALQGRIDRLERERIEIENAVAAAQGRRGRLLEAKGRLEADRSALWMEFIALHEKRNASAREAAAAEARLAEFRQQRDALHGEVEMLKRVVATLNHPEMRT